MVHLLVGTVRRRGAEDAECAAVAGELSREQTTRHICESQSRRSRPTTLP
jgi:hypothetical protein